MCLIFLTLSACGGKNPGVGSDDSSESSAGPDYAKSEWVIEGTGVANGQSIFSFSIKLINSDDTPVVNFKPLYEVTSGNGVAASPCSKTNESGIANCSMKSTEPGTKVVSVTNLPIKLKGDILFSLAANSALPMMGFGGMSPILTSGRHQQTKGRFRLSANFSGPSANAVKTKGSFKLRGSFNQE